jgi:hypothetical protein
MLCMYFCSPKFVKLAAVDAVKVIMGNRGWLTVVAVGMVAVAVTAMLCR